MIGYYNYTVWLTFVGMLSSVVGMGFAVQGKIIAAVICLMFSGFCDMFDGIVARTKKDRMRKSASASSSIRSAILSASEFCRLSSVCAAEQGSGGR